MSSTAVFAKVKVTSQNRDASQEVALKIARTFAPLGHVDGEPVQGARGDWLTFIDVVATPKDGES